MKNQKIDLSTVPYTDLMEEVKKRREEHFMTRINQINDLLKELALKGCNVIDIDNPEYALSEIVYNREDDEVYFQTAEMA